MYKSIIQQKIILVLEKRRKAAEESSTKLESRAKCKDCGEIGHYNKGYYKCPQYSSEAATDVGTRGKRKQSASVKSDKKKAKRAKKDDASIATCKSCREEGHTSSRSFECINHIRTKEETMKGGLGCDYTTFTRKLRLEGSTNTDYLTKLQNNIITTANDIRQIIHRSQLFLIIGKTITNKNAVPSSLTTFWNTFKELHPNIIYSETRRSDSTCSQNRNGVTEAFWRTSKKRKAAGDLLVVTIDEYKTSRICNNCYTDSLKSLEGVRGQSILDYKSSTYQHCLYDIYSTQFVFTSKVQVYDVLPNTTLPTHRPQ
ncbi:MAG: hypothetical protein EXX96DRAFT_629094 [Benjaminiella poitrasii]|nr:MAG: hypothetical protein EXX96DRAFT_629094 [Benjaminiella poitrasii]